MTTYRLTFLHDAKKEWHKLGSNIRGQFARKLDERLMNPRVPSARLSGLPDCYKIKLRAAGYRLVYRVYDERIVVQVVASAAATATSPIRSRLSAPSELGS